jgi:outer membrane lipoprotein SlyB
MTHAVVGVFNTTANAERAVADLIERGFLKEKISLIAPKSTQAEHITVAGSAADHAEDMAIGAVGGSLMGGMLGALVGMIVVGIPGLGAVLVAGPLAAAIGGTTVTMVVGAASGAVGGGVLGALTWAGVTKAEAHVYEDLVREGNTLVMVQTSNDKMAEATEILHRDGAAEPADIENVWRHEGLS